MSVSVKTNDRWEKIVALVNERAYLTVNQLSELCRASEITIRRDLAKLDHQKRIRRTHGGAASNHATLEPALKVETPPESLPDTPLFNHLDALITAQYLPRLSSLVQKGSHNKPVPLIMESLPMPESETCVTVDNYQAGFDIGCWAANYATEHWNGSVHILDLTYHRPNTQARSRGFIDGLRSLLPSAELLLSINTQSRYAMAYQLTRDALSVHPNLNLIFAINDVSARGAYDACKDLGIAPDQLIILTFGIEGPAMQDLIMADSWIKAGVCMFPEIVGATCIEAAIAAYRHQPLSPQLITPFCIATRETLPNLYQKTARGWRLQWQVVASQLKLPLPVDTSHPDRSRRLPANLGFICTFVEHDWYKTMIQTMREYTSALGIRLEVREYEQTVKDELRLRRIEIARRAALEVKPGDTIFLDAGPISDDLAEQLSHRDNITVITNSLPVIDLVKDSQAEITLISTGGAYRRSSQVFVGPTAEATLKEFHIDKLFLMVGGVSKNFGLYHTNISEVTIKQQMIRSAREVILLADYSCFQQEALIQVAPVTAIHKLITDDALPASVRLELGTLGISVILATT